MSEARQAGAHGYLVKGCRPSHLLETVEQALAGRTERSAPAGQEHAAPARDDQSATGGRDGG